MYPHKHDMDHTGSSDQLMLKGCLWVSQLIAVYRQQVCLGGWSLNHVTFALLTMRFKWIGHNMTCQLRLLVANKQKNLFTNQTIIDYNFIMTEYDKITNIIRRSKLLLLLIFTSERKPSVCKIVECKLVDYAIIRSYKN